MKSSKMQISKISDISTTFLSIQEVLKCSEHGKELTLFCKEAQCQMLICSVCMTRKHKKHDVVDVDENRKEELVTNLTSAIEHLSFNKDEITKVQVKNERCLKTLKEEQRSVLKLMTAKYDSLIRQAANHTEDSRSKMASVEEKLILLNNIKQKTNRGTPSQREVKNYQEAVNGVSDQAPLELHYLEFTENKDRERLMEELCGELVVYPSEKQRTILTGAPNNNNNNSFILFHMYKIVMF